ncbi:DMT family transporter [Avibacterium paragallinarum]|uniref:DMT family transporter n=1 Tax=Avibacterium paragallinarum TaxID=728 RepID=A0A0F5EZA4_AVIPA|nr:DMT family transporter [Avibacterium paragallinarum]KAA6210043.1 DMT family transporter [Avibacterium paragallinarum]KKB01933.1 transporter [Avibacterium paragallinarum]POY46081.1 EamA/RhaT family transporter [Avibacterium paragallinarum]RZN57782.1 DMT family transporter [Avibacterium paragallinarum]RZN60702.1 DMT family transporter [Avibacterium paragallinarum]
MKQQPLLGFTFALITAMAWGSLPIALKQVVSVMSPQTIVWYRFIVASLALVLLLGVTKKLPKLSEFNKYYVGLLVFGIIGLAGNFSLFNTALKFAEPSVTQIFIHLSSFAMLLCGVVIFKERLGLHQKIGLGILIVGLGLFFNNKFDQFTHLNNYLIGILLSICAALIWVAYGLAQKLMLRKFTAQQILLMFYFGCAVLFTPFAEFNQVKELNGLTLICFIYCCLNTLIGYGAYAEALNRWEVAKVSVVVTLVPLFTILFSHLLHLLDAQDFAAPELNSLSYIGALVVVLGAMFSAIGHKFIKNHN